MFGLSNYVLSKLGKNYVELPIYLMSEIYADSSNITPIIFIL
jgi:hypothetical protein